jgi:major vault protein
MSKTSTTTASNNSTIKIDPYCYMHILDQTTNVTRLVQGPVTFIKQDHEEIVLPQTKMVKLAPNTYITIRNPVVRDTNKKIVQDKFGVIEVQFGELQIRC